MVEGGEFGRVGNLVGWGRMEWVRGVGYKVGVKWENFREHSGENSKKIPENFRKFPVEYAIYHVGKIK